MRRSGDGPSLAAMRANRFRNFATVTTAGVDLSLASPFARALVACLFSAFVPSCVSFVDLRPPAKGSVENPIECASPLQQRGYLKRLRRSDGETRVQSEYLDSVAGPRDVILDRFRVDNPAPDQRGIGAILLDLFRSEPEYPPAFRIYMSIYGAGPCELEPVPGYKFLGPKDRTTVGED